MAISVADRATGRNMRFTVRASVVPCATQPTRLDLDPTSWKPKPMHSSLADLPAPSGLYDPRFEHDACGVSFVANIKGVRSRDIVSMGIGALCNMEHRGATGAEADTGDGAGILIQVPDRFLARASPTSSCRPPARYAVGLAFLPADPVDAEKAQASIEAIVADEGLTRARLARRAGRPDCLGASAPRGDAGVPAAVRRRSRRRRRHRPRPQGVRRPQAHRARAADPSSARTSRRSAVAP